MTDWEKLWPTDEPPSGFAERVLAAARPRRRRIWPIALAATAIAAAAAVFVTSDGGVARGTRSFAARGTIAIGARGTAVGEAGAELSWLVHRGRAEIEQRAGDVFYRVERGGPFVVRTPAGDVRVTGTSFRVEVDDMKKTLLPMAAGAALATAVLVTVYEGKVILANERGQTSLTAGQSASARAGEPPSEARDRAPSPSLAQLAPLPSGTTTREELLARDKAQRAELERLRTRVAELESSSAAGAHDAKSKPFYDPAPDELKKLADECKLKWDAPTLGARPDTVSADDARELGLSDQERAEIDRIAADTQTRVAAQLRALYVEVTGDKAGADALAPISLEQEILEKSRRDDVKAAFQRIAQERAGLARPPADPSSEPAVERMQRLLVSLGDSYEHDVGRAIGPDRARQLRALHDGWGSRHRSSYGCPGER